MTQSRRRRVYTWSRNRRVPSGVNNTRTNPAKMAAERKRLMNQYARLRGGRERSLQNRGLATGAPLSLRERTREAKKQAIRDNYSFNWEKSGGRNRFASDPWSYSPAGRDALNKMLGITGIKSSKGFLNGKPVLDTDKLNVKYNTITGDIDKLHNQGNLRIKMERYVAGYTENGRPIYRYKPVVSRQAYHGKLGSVFSNFGYDGDGVKSYDNSNDEFLSEKDIEARNNLKKRAYRDEWGNIRTEQVAPDFVKTGINQNKRIDEQEMLYNDRVREVRDWVNQGNNIYDWVKAGKDLRVWDTYAKSRGDFVENKDGVFWENAYKESNAPELQKLKDDKDRALQEINNTINREITRRVSNIQDLPQDVLEKLRPQIEADVRGRYKERIDEINRLYDEGVDYLVNGRGDSIARKVAEIQRGYETDAEKQQKELEIANEMNRLREEWKEKYPDTPLNEMQLRDLAKKNLSKNPFEAQRNIEIQKMLASGGIQKGEELDKTYKMFDGNIEKLRNYWNDYLPKAEIDRQLEKIYTDNGYTPEQAKEKVSFDNMTNWFLTKEQGGLLSDAQEMEIRNAMFKNPGLYYASYKAALAKAEGREPTFDEIQQWKAEGIKKFNDAQSKLSKKSSEGSYGGGDPVLYKLKTKKPQTYSFIKNSILKAVEGKDVKTLADVVNAVSQNSSEFSLDSVNSPLKINDNFYAVANEVLNEMPQKQELPQEQDVLAEFDDLKEQPTIESKKGLVSSVWDTVKGISGMLLDEAKGKSVFDYIF